MSILKQVQTKYFPDAKFGNTLAQLETSWDMRKTLRRVRSHQWRKSDIFLVLQTIVLVICFIIIREPPVLIRLIIGALLALAVLIPITSQFFFPALPILIWLILFYSCKFISPDWRPRIYVRVLPALETILYGGNLSDVLSSKTNNVLDILAWIPYGLVHYGAPFVLAAIIFVFAPPKTLPCFSFAFGWMNLIGVTIQILFPCAPPWYQNLYGLQPANYSMPGSPGGLARVDKILGLNMYTGAFTASPQVFGAFPSLHSGSAVMEALFLCYMFPRFSALFVGYVFWIWWSTMYLTHHYFVDLIGGAVLSFVVFYGVKRTWLPRMQNDKLSRWSYDYIETGDESPVKFRKSMDVEGAYGEYELPLYNKPGSELKFCSSEDKNLAPSSRAMSSYLPPIETNLSNGITNISPASSKKNNQQQHSRNKSSSYYMYDSSVYTTSKSNNNSNMSNNLSSLNSSNVLGSPFSNNNSNSSNSPLSSSSFSVSSNSPDSTPTSLSLTPSSTSGRSLMSLSRPISTSPVEDNKKVLFSRNGSPSSHKD